MALTSLVNVLRAEIIRQAKADSPDAPWIDPESDTFFRIDGPVNLVLLAEAVTDFCAAGTASDL